MNEKRIRRMPLPLCLDNPLHMEALKIIEAIPKGKRTEFICKKVTAKEDAVSPALRNAMYEAVKQALREHGAVSVQQATVVEPERSQEEKDAQAKEFERNFLGFLKELEAMGEGEEDED